MKSSRAGQLSAESSVESAVGDGLQELKGPIFDLLTPFTTEGDVDFKAFGDYLRVRPLSVPTTYLRTIIILMDKCYYCTVIPIEVFYL